MSAVAWLRIAERVNPQHEWFTSSPVVWDTYPAGSRVLLTGQRVGQVVRSWENIEDFGIRYYLISLDSGGKTVTAQYRIRGAVTETKLSATA